MEKFEETIEKRLTARHIKSIAFVGEFKDKIILDIGCSYGWFEKFATEKECKEIIGIELEEKILERAKQQISDKRSRFQVGSAIDLSGMKESYFDTVVMWEVLEHIPKGTERKAFKEICRVLKKGGVFYLSTPNKTFISNVTDPAWYIGHRHYTAEKVKQMLEKEGFEVEQIEKVGSIYEIVSMLLFYPFKWVFNSEIPFKGWFEKKKKKEFSQQGFTTLFVKARKR